MVRNRLSEISHNFPTVSFLDLAGKPSFSHHKTKTKIINEETLRRLNENLQTKAWDRVFNCNDADAAFDILTREVTDSIQRTIPEKTASGSMTAQNPWLSKGMLKSIKHKNKLYKP